MKKITYLTLPVVALVSIGALAGCSNSSAPTATASTASAATTSSASTADAASPVLPVSTNPISNPATNQDLKVVSAAVEDLVDPVSGQAINDRLMLTLQNSGTTDLTGFEVYYTMTDVVTGATESYYQALDGFALAAGATDYVYFDNQTEPGHYPENQFSLFRSSANEVDFQIQVSAQGAAVATATTVKSTGTGEAVD